MAQNFPAKVTIFREQRGHELRYFWVIEGERHYVPETLALQYARSQQATIRTPEDHAKALQNRVRNRLPPHPR